MTISQVARVRRPVVLIAGCLLLGGTACRSLAETLPSQPGVNDDAGSNAGGDATAVFPDATPDGDSSAAGATGDGGDADSGPACSDLTASSCATPRWHGVLGPAPTFVPTTINYSFDAELTLERWDWIKVALFQWGPSYGNFASAVSFEELVDAGSQDIAGLHFVGSDGCGVVEWRADAAQFAVGSCQQMSDVAREIGVALGLPRLHQRADSGRYLHFASSEEFDCTGGEFYAACSLLGQEPGLGTEEPGFGPFLLDSVMFAPAAGSRAAKRCELRPAGDYLYLPKSLAFEPTDVENCERSFGRLRHPILDIPAVIPSDRAALIELYAASAGWRASVPIARDDGDDRPLVFELQPIGNPALVSLGAEGLAGFSIAHDGRLWQIGNAGTGWEVRAKVRPPPVPPEPYSTSLSVASWSGSSERLDLVVNLSREIFHLSYAGEWGVWSSLGMPVSGALSAPAIISSGIGKLTVYVVDYDHALWRNDFADGVWSGWQPTPLPALSDMWSVAAVAHGSEEHLVASTSEAVLYAIKDTQNGWSDWLQISNNPGYSPAIVVLPSGRVDVFVADGRLGLWRHTCNDARCSQDSSRWAVELIGGDLLGPPAAAASIWGVDLIYPRAPVSGQPASLWHKLRRE